VALAGRLHGLVVPGVMVLNLPGPHGREWTGAIDWGTGSRLPDFRVPGWRRSATLHINVVRTCLPGDRPRTVNSALNIAGFSVTLNQATLKSRLSHSRPAQYDQSPIEALGAGV
jgi:hypothetical protein